MTRDQADMLIVWLADGLALIRTWIDAQVTPQSPLQPIPGVLPKEPGPGPKRKRGRPCLTSEQKAVRAQMMRDAEFAAFGPPPKEIVRDEQAPKTYSCSYCGRILPIAVRELHEANCRSAAVGYATHVAQPGKGGGGSNLE